MTTQINLRECVACGNKIKSGHIHDNKEYCESCYQRKFNQSKSENSKPSAYAVNTSPDIPDIHDADFEYINDTDFTSNTFSRDNTYKKCGYLGCDLPVSHLSYYCYEHTSDTSEEPPLFKYNEPRIDKETENNSDLQLDARHVTMFHTSESILAVGIGPLIFFGFILFGLNDWNSYEKHHWIISFIFCGFYLPFVAGIRFIERFAVAFWPMLMWYCIFLGGALFLFSWILPWEVCYPLAYIVGILPWLVLMITNSSNYR